MAKLLLSIVLILSVQTMLGQNSVVNVDMTEANWTIPKDAVFETFDNRKTLLLPGKRAVVKNLQFTNGTIEVDIYANKKRSFGGIFFRKENSHMEEVYLRMHKSSQVDAVQYTPIFHGESNWQLYNEHQAKETFKNEGWNRLRIEVNKETAEVFVNDTKVLTVDNLRTERNIGEVGLFALFGNRFSNFKVTPKEAVETTSIKDKQPVDSAIITEWKITQAMPYNAQTLNVKDFTKQPSQTVQTEASGLLPISKYVKKSSSGNFGQNKENYIVASKIIDAEDDKTQLFSFDYSDKIMVYLNGQLLFKGNNSFRAKGVQYMGHLGINANSLYLPLKKGTNMLHCVVIDRANGWGLMGKLE
jgi:hypothetical protein